MHPALRLALWLWLAAWLPWLERHLLYALTAVLVLFALRLARPRFLRALPRMRWLLLAVGSIYGWTTPGEYLWSGWHAPTHEGLWLGLAQMARLLAITASLQILLTRMSRAAIFSGLYTLAAPLNWFGLRRETVALRLSLTLEMLENLLETPHPFKLLLRELHLPVTGGTAHVVRLTRQPLSPLQGVGLAMLLLAVLVTLSLGSMGVWA